MPTRLFWLLDDTLSPGDRISLGLWGPGEDGGGESGYFFFILFYFPGAVRLPFGSNRLSQTSYSLPRTLAGVLDGSDSDLVRAKSLTTGLPQTHFLVRKKSYSSLCKVFCPQRQKKERKEKFATDPPPLPHPPKCSPLILGFKRGESQEVTSASPESQWKK